MDHRNIFEKSQEGQHGYSLPREDPAFAAYTPPSKLRRNSDLPLPEISELDLTRHFSQLAAKNVGIDTRFYPLGSCTMKFNPRINEVCCALPAFAQCHPLSSPDSVQGSLTIIYELIERLCAITGMQGGTLCPNAGAQGEFTGVRLIAAYHQKRREKERNQMIVPDSAHGTNPATAALMGFETLSVKSSSDGDLDLSHLKSLLSRRTAALMLTNPSTLGLFSSKILEISRLVHEAGGLLFYDGANLNAILNVARPGDMGFDALHINLHKTFSTPHGGGGPGSGPVLCNDKLIEFLPVPRVVKEQDRYDVQWQAEKSIGHICSFFGNFAVCLRAYLYIKLHGDAGLRRIAQSAVLNANYLKYHLSSYFTDPYPDQRCMHEFVLQADRDLDKGVKALDIAKRMLDYGVHAPTIYFPLIVRECMLIEPTESESKDTLDRFIEIVQAIAQEIAQDPELVKTAPHHTQTARLDEVRAARKPILHAFIPK